MFLSCFDTSIKLKGGRPTGRRNRVKHSLVNTLLPPTTRDRFPGVRDVNVVIEEVQQENELLFELTRIDRVGTN